MKRILYVEHHRRESTGWMNAVLAEQDFRVTTAPSGSAAIRQLAAGDFDVILLGLPVPARPEDRLIEWVAGNRPHLKSRILVVSETALSAGAAALLESLEIPALFAPFTAGDLVHWVNAVLARAERQFSRPFHATRPQALAS